jgi:hypothetical protein
LVQGKALYDLKVFEPSRWKASQASAPISAPFFLRPSFLQEALEPLRLPTERRELFLRAADRVRRSPQLSQLAWHCHWLIYLDKEENWYSGEPWVEGLKKALGPEAGGFPGLALFGGMPRLKSFYSKFGISNRVFVDTLSGVNVWMDHYRDHHRGAVGFAHISWLMYHFRGRLFRLGRLEFMRKEFGGEVRAFRNRGGEVMLLLNPGKKFNWYNGLGQVDWKSPKSRLWRARPFRETAGAYEGHAVTGSGSALRETLQLPKKTWTQVLKPGDPLLDVHIPAGEPMDDAACMDAYGQAMRFYPRTFGYHPKGFICWSWLFEPKFQDLLPPTSNIVKFQDRYHRFPVASGDHEIFYRIFPETPKDYSKGPRDTFIRRAILDYYRAGNKFTGGGAGILKAHLAG